MIKAESGKKAESRARVSPLKRIRDKGNPLLVICGRPV
jgi:hypothetical protein